MSDPGLYVHVPFCRSKCAYCGFVSQTGLAAVPSWLKALEKEASLYKDVFGAFDTLFIGGGTPTVLLPSQLDSLAECLFRELPFKQPVEFTVEANPDDLDTGTLAVLKDIGVNRLSLGIQSLEEKELAFLGRRHSVRQAERALELAARSGFGSLSADLIYGLPGQTLSDWLETLKRVLAFEPDHLSCYQLTVERHTPLGRMVADKKVKKARAKQERELFLATSQFLERESYLHYEISNFARPGHLCRHNLKYWNRSPYLGLGPSAHSFEGDARWWNTPSVRSYCLRLSHGLAPVRGKEILSQEKRIMESLLLGFRTMQGIEIDMVREVSGLDSRMCHLLDNGLIVVREGRIIPTREGFLYADGLPLLFT